ncbi:uncharacterized protein E0L32_008514 [Thyridium curvatum]|uniref:Uncharacterized protein n=1 Tax=Thyridium curvatum TaxID=1093900 RepID=A0A507AVE1_9PEZI|nr:uncharacterized protein E0L32_008514 [Thyridium curvatum]TPX10464.1 hypothetical protein E0L32_008514 [Thyridium curvatum]
MSDHSSGYIGSDGRRRHGQGGDAAHRRPRHRHRHHGAAEDDKVDPYGSRAVALRRHALARVPEAARSDVSSEVEYEYDHRDRRYEDSPRRHREDRRRRNGRDHRHAGIIVGLVILLASFILCWRGNEDSDDDD